MSLRLETLQVARLAPQVLDDSASLVEDFVRGQLRSDGGFPDRAGRSDLYYTVFGIDCLLALQTELPRDRLVEYVESFTESSLNDLDLVHLACLAHCRATLDLRASEFDADVATQLTRFRTADGGYNVAPEAKSGTIYGCYLALGAYQNFGGALPDPDGVCSFIDSMRTADCGYSNDAEITTGATPAVAAAVGLLRNLGRSTPEGVAEWLAQRFHAAGGFLAIPDAPMPDLLSTATALHALAGLQYPFDRFVDPCLDYIDSLWTNRGSFYGNWSDIDLDCEYTFYALLALGHLSL